jgi:hypothetical protein
VLSLVASNFISLKTVANYVTVLVRATLTVA